MIMKKLYPLFVIVFLLSSCSLITSQHSNDKKLTIYTSIYPLQYVTNAIVGDVAKVHSIYPPGVDAHTYEPTLKEMTSIAKSDLFIYLGEGMESFSEKVALSLSSQDLQLIEIGKHKYLFSSVDGHDVDPHIWLDPLRMIEVGKIIKDDLVKLYPDQETLFNENLNKLTEDLIQLDDTFINTLQKKENKEVIVSHAAYGYWEERYGIKQLPISGIITTDEPSQKELVQIVKNIKESNLKYIIFDQTGEHRLSTIVQQHTNTEKRTIHDLEVLTENDIQNNEDYISIMAKNLQALNEVTK